MKITMYTQTGEKKGDVEVNDKIFAVKPNEQLIHQALVRQMANGRQASAHVKTRGEVTGSTRKIYRQKGTGGARHGSRYSNIFRGGGRVFGPRNVKNYEKAMPRKQRRLALFSALSILASEKKIAALDAFKAEAPKTKVAATMMEKLPVESALLVSGETNEALEKSVSNLPNAKVVTVNFLNVADILKYDTVIFLEDALKKIDEHYL
jgi:large subunit ribosomal protein L4